MSTVPWSCEEVKPLSLRKKNPAVFSAKNIFIVYFSVWGIKTHTEKYQKVHSLSLSLSLCIEKSKITQILISKKK